MQESADHHRTPAPSYQSGYLKRISLDSRKLTSNYIGPIEIDNIINPAAVHLKLSQVLKSHPTFHVSLPKPLCMSSLNPPTDPSPGPRIIDDAPAFTVRTVSLTYFVEVKVSSTLLIGRDVLQRSILGSPGISFWIAHCFRIFITFSQTNQARRRKRSLRKGPCHSSCCHLQVISFYFSYFFTISFLLLLLFLLLSPRRERQGWRLWRLAVLHTLSSSTITALLLSLTNTPTRCQIIQFPTVVVQPTFYE